jgi:peptide deformylase
MSKRKNRVTAKLRLAGDPILTKVCEPVADGEDVTGIIRDMRHVLLASKTGVGLAAPQAGHLKRIIIAGKTWVLINPKIQSHSDYQLNAEEGCLSYPGEFKWIKRWATINVVYTGSDGLVHVDDFLGQVARIIQHEIDHLDGKCKVGAV